MKIYIAGPMSGYQEFNYPAFQAAEGRLRVAGFDALNPAHHDITGDIQPWDFYMRDAIALLIQADAVALLDGWSESRGASLEYDIARGLKMKIRHVEEWLR